MKIYIRTAEQHTAFIRSENVIDVYYSVPDGSVWSIISAGITPVAWGDGRVDEQALADHIVTSKISSRGICSYQCCMF